MYAIETNNLTKRYGEFEAVDEVSVKVSSGEIFGLLGPNGAGKTTLISMLVTTRKPTSGEARINGVDVVKNPDETRNNVGIVFQDPSLDEELTAYENLELHAAIYGIPKKEWNKRINEVIEMVELKDRLYGVVKTFSGGMRRRLEIARGLMHNPNILFLDEPTLGLDPQTREHVWSYIKKLQKKQRITVVLTTHYMDEADSLCDRIAIMNHGKIVALDKSSNLKNSLGGDVLEIETNKKNTEKFKQILQKESWIKDVKDHDGKLVLHVELGEKKIPGLMSIAQKNHIEISSVNLHKPTLDDVFLHYTGKMIRETESNKESMRLRRRAWGGHR